MDRKKVTINDIAEALQVTASTVARALQDHPRISDKTKKRVIEKARELNYHPNSMASNLRKGKSNTIGLVIPRINRNFFSNTISGIEQVLQERGFQLLICQSNEKFEREVANIQTMIQNRVEGILISISEETQDYSHLQLAQEAGVPVVQFDRVGMQFPGGKVLNDDLVSAFDLTNHLIDKGYRNIGYVGGRQYLNIYQNRFGGFQQAMDARGLTLNPAWVSHDALSQERGEELARAWFSGQNHPDAIFAASDFSALGMLLEVKRMGFRVPEEVGITGYANEPFTALIVPTLTSVDQKGLQMGQAAARLLLDQIDSRVLTDISEPIWIRPGLMIRESSMRKSQAE